MMKRYETVQQYIDDLDQWQDEIIRLREIVLAVGLEETTKWAMPVYVADGKNVVGLSAMKSYFGLWFYQGVLLTDPESVLMNAQEGKTKAMRQWRFESKKQIKVRLIKQYLHEAIELVKQGKSIKPNRNKPIFVPPELTKALSANRAASGRFDQLSKSCQREYADYISEAKRDETKQRRIEKIIPMILQSNGLNDKYR